METDGACMKYTDLTAENRFSLHQDGGDSETEIIRQEH